jgi:hypothetical protein
VAADSPASLLLLALFELAPSQSMSLILPAELSRLPWLARAVSGTRADSGDFAPGRIVLEASVSSWLMARQAEAKTPTTSDGLGHAVYTRVPIALDQEERILAAFGEIEAGAVSRVWGVDVTAAGGPVELLRALQAPGPAHLCVHGAYDPFEPRNSFMSLANGQVTLPAWLLQGVAVLGDVGLSACESMLVGTGVDKAQWDGPVGIGPLLRAHGARTVIGPLGKSHPLVSWFFYALWYEARQALPAVQALARAQQQLRAMTYAEVKTKIRIVPVQFDALDYALRQLAPQGAGCPFSHPASWAQFVLLGDAPALPPPAAAMKSNQDGKNAGRGFWARLKRLVDRPPTD